MPRPGHASTSFARRCRPWAGRLPARPIARTGRPARSPIGCRAWQKNHSAPRWLLGHCLTTGLRRGAAPARAVRWGSGPRSGWVWPAGQGGSACYPGLGGFGFGPAPATGLGRFGGPAPHPHGAAPVAAKCPATNRWVAWRAGLRWRATLRMADGFWWPRWGVPTSLKPQSLHDRHINSHNASIIHQYQ